MTCTPDSMETLLQIMFCVFTKDHNWTPEQANNISESQRKSFQFPQNSPFFEVNEVIQKMNWSNYAHLLNSYAGSDVWKNIKSTSNAEKFFKQCFSNPSEFIITVQGNFGLFIFSQYLMNKFNFNLFREC